MNTKHWLYYSIANILIYLITTVVTAGDTLQRQDRPAAVGGICLHPPRCISATASPNEGVYSFIHLLSPLQPRGQCLGTRDAHRGVLSCSPRAAGPAPTDTSSMALYRSPCARRQRGRLDFTLLLSPSCFSRSPTHNGVLI